MDEREALFRQALQGCTGLLMRYPGHGPLLSISRQLEYLIGLETKEITDRSRLKDIIIGVQTAREIESLDDDLADLLHRVSGVVRQMCVE